jgi:nucleotide-binding universal stress UspA family protein
MLLLDRPNAGRRRLAHRLPTKGANARWRRSMKHLLVATDLSASSDQAIARAVILASQISAQLTVVHVVDAIDLPRREATAKAEIAAQLARLSAGQAPVTIKVVGGKHVEAILTAAKDASADILVIGKHRAVEDLGVFRGSTGERMVRSGTHSVLLVKTEASGAYQKIVIGVDFSPSSRRAVEFALGTFASAEFVLLHAYAPPTVPGDINARLDAQFTEFMSGLDASRCSQLSRQGPPAPTLLKSIAAIGPDLVITGTSGRGGAGPMRIGTVAERLLTESSTDVLAVRA